MWGISLFHENIFFTAILSVQGLPINILSTFFTDVYEEAKRQIDSMRKSNEKDSQKSQETELTPYIT